MVRKFLIGIAGTHSTGKSSFCNILSESLLSIGVKVSKVPSFGKLALELGIPLLRDHTFESTLWFINKTLEAKENAMRNSHVVIVERPEIDSFAYWKAAIDYNKKDWIPEEREKIQSLVLENTKDYTHFFATKLNPLIPLAPGRDDDVKFRKSVDFHLHQLTQSLPNKITILRSDEHENTLLKLYDEITTALRT
ncbi:MULTISPECIES: AAA family ATPase [Pectobacterium]|uniref:AAA family ATPase n=1 Tax=Pectobacterium TaxID=122277 RepID=UPI00050603F4|nr:MULTISPECIES: AAA family ATPase [Pectobacterium]KFX10309.1 hypothetical protein KP17_19210 [Pectobacterium parvum]GKW36715.1 hypothetical protein PEC301875_07390 [Pectobacterium carotovorum subsp. carotovorum]